MANRLFIWIVAGLILFVIPAFGGLDQSGSAGSENLSMADFNALGLEGSQESAVVNAGAPQMTAEAPGTELATYTDQTPPAADLKKLMPSGITTNPPAYMYYNGNYFAWNTFTATFPGNQPGLWIERAVSWSLYATLPLGAWTQELLYVPVYSPLTMYEIYPSGFVIEYSLGAVQPGYYYIWYYADTPGRHRNVFATRSGYSNTVIIDVYSIGSSPKPTPPPDPKKECEKNPLCKWENGVCDCFHPVPNPVAECEKNPYCQWANGQCLCTMPDPEKEKCEENPSCDYVDGHCYCRGLNPEPEPQPEPQPSPGPFNPAPNPVAQCEQNPSCHWSDGRCLCTGLLTGGESGESGDTGNIGDIGATGDLGATSEGHST
jgi:hypothetical protein